MGDEPTLVPEYRMEFENHPNRSTNEIDVRSVMSGEPSLDMEGVHTALEELAAHGRADPECDVTLLGYSN